MLTDNYEIPSKHDGHTLVFRSAEESDAEELLRYENEVSRETDFLVAPEDIEKRTVDDQVKKIKTAAESKSAYWDICCVDGKIVGSFRGLRETRKREQHRGTFSISIKREYWGSGIGTEFIRYFLKWAKEQGLTQILISMVEGNSRARKLYERFGFKIICYIPKYYRYYDEYKGKYTLYLDLGQYKEV